MSYTTLWEVPDGLWEKMERILPREKPARTVGCRPGEPPSGQRDLVYTAQGLPMERSAAGMVRCQQQSAQAVSNLERSRVVEEGLSHDGEVLS